MLKILLIAAFGAVGALLRYAVSGWALRTSTGAFPVGTLVVNLAGCLVIGVLGAVFAGPHLIREEYRAAILVGMLGAFTTFSTFGLETFELANNGQYRLAGLNILLSNLGGLAAVWIGYRVTQQWVGA